MIIYGLTMQGEQGEKEEIPKEVAEWLMDRVSKYPKVDFEISRWPVVHEADPTKKSEHEQMIQKYSRIFWSRSENSGVFQVSFWYGSEYWSVKIIGGVNDAGEIISRDDYQIRGVSLRPFSPQLRNEIAGLTDIESECEKIAPKAWAKIRRDNEPVQDTPQEFIPFPPDLVKTSQLSMTGEQLGQLFDDPEIKGKVHDALYKKDWEALKKLRDSKLH